MFGSDWLNFTQKIRFECPFSSPEPRIAKAIDLVVSSKILTYLSLPAVANKRPSGLKSRVQREFSFSGAI
jgi:hypothetical protein